MALGDAWRLIGRGLPRFPMTPRQLHDLTSPYVQKRVMITFDRGGRRLASSDYTYGTARALPVHPFLLLFFFFPATRHPHGPAEEVLGRGEGKSPSGRAWLSPGQAWPGPPPQTSYGFCGGFPWSWKQSSERLWAPGCRWEACGGYVPS